MSSIKGECSECYKPLDAEPGQTSITCPSCGCIHDIVYFPKLQPRRNQPASKPYKTRSERRSEEISKVLGYVI